MKPKNFPDRVERRRAVAQKREPIRALWPRDIRFRHNTKKPGVPRQILSARAS